MGAHGNAPRAAGEGFHRREGRGDAGGPEARQHIEGLALFALARGRLITTLAELARRLLAPRRRLLRLAPAGLAPRLAHLTTGRWLVFGTVLLSWKRALARAVRSAVLPMLLFPLGVEVL